jgi:ATP-dependent Clp protease adaptor protein ClpS
LSGGKTGNIAQTPNFPRCEVSLLNDDHTPMEFVVGVLERFFGMLNDEAITQMYRIHNEGKAICGTYSREEAEKKVADVLAFAASQGHPLQCVLKQED